MQNVLKMVTFHCLPSSKCAYYILKTMHPVTLKDNALLTPKGL
jgi:hypothetical protein